MNGNIKSSRALFGTDGIRGTANAVPMTAEMALRLAMATAAEFSRTAPDKTGRVIIGKDTRLSGYMFENAMSAGFIAMGMEVLLVGPVPTPAVAMFTRSMRADLGVMISASHNPYRDNGIKIFAADGFKLPDAVETRIEAALADPSLADHLNPDLIGRATRLEDETGRYAEVIKATFPKGQNLKGMKVVVDCANGAAYKAAPKVLWELGADVVSIAVNPNGRNINDECGATRPALLQKTVLEEGANIGIALDGDADRVILVDEKGNIIDGDQLIAVLATEWKKMGRLSGSAVAGTVMCNLGFERYLKWQGIDLLRTAVGDRYVVEAMREKGINLGGEPSGHVVMTDYGTTGDGLLSAVQALAALTRAGQVASDLFQAFTPVPQVLESVSYEKNTAPLEKAPVQQAIEAAKEKLGADGRILVRASGTESVIRVMAEGDDPDMIRGVVRGLCDTITRQGRTGT